MAALRIAARQYAERLEIVKLCTCYASFRSPSVRLAIEASEIIASSLTYLYDGVSLLLCANCYNDPGLGVFSTRSSKFSHPSNQLWHKSFKCRLLSLLAHNSAIEASYSRQPALVSWLCASSLHRHTVSSSTHSLNHKF